MVKLLVSMIFLILMSKQIYAQNVNIVTDQEKQLTYGLIADIYSKYMFRGYNLSEGNVIQPSSWISYKNITLSLWSNLDLKNHLNKPKCSEIDVILNYNYSFKNFSIEPAVQFYYYPNDEESPTTGETTLRLSYNINEFSVSTSQNLDFIEYKGSYYTDASIGYEHWFNDNSGLNLQLCLGWSNPAFNEEYLGLRKSTFIAFFNISYTQYTYGGLYIKPKLEVSNIFDNEIEEYTELKQPYFNFGFSMGIDF